MQINYGKLATGLSSVALFAAMGGPSWAAGVITGDQMADNTITNTQIADDNIDATSLATASVGQTELKGNAVLSGNVVDGTLSTSDLAPDAVNSAKIANESVTWEDVEDYEPFYTSGPNGPQFAGYHGGLRQEDIRPGAIGTAQVGHGVLTGFHIADNVLDSNDLAEDSVGLSELASNSVLSGNIVNGSVSGADDIQPLSLKNDRIANNEIGNAKMKITRGVLNVGNGGVKLTNAGQCALITTPVTRSAANDLVMPQGLSYAAATGSTSSSFVVNVRNQEVNPFRTFYEICATQANQTIPSGLRFNYAILAS